MAGFVQNLDDGELWLPSELIADVGLSCYRHCSGAFSGARVLHESEVECLANNLPPFGTFDRLHLRRAVKQPLSVPPFFEGFKRVTPLGWFGALEKEIWAGPCPQETQSGLRVLSSPGAYRGRVASGFLAEMFRDHPASPVQLQGFPDATASGSKPLLRSAGCAGKTEVRRNRCVSSAREGTGERIHRRSSKAEINEKPINEKADESISVSLRGGSSTGMDLLRVKQTPPVILLHFHEKPNRGKDPTLCSHCLSVNKTKKTEEEGVEWCGKEMKPANLNKEWNIFHCRVLMSSCWTLVYI